MEIIDLTYELNPDTPVYPGDNKPLLIQSSELAKEGFTDFTLTAGMHTATHVDGSMHMIQSRNFISEADISHFIGNGILINIFDEQVIEWKRYYDELIPENSIVILNTGHSKKFNTDQYFTDHPVISENFAEKLTIKKIKLLGMDLPSPDYPPFAVHKILMRSGIFIAENLTNLDKLNSYKNFMIAALPLKVRADSAPARIIAIIF